MTLFYRQWGSRDHGLPFLLLHGHPGNADCLSVFAEALLPDHWVIAPDLRGYGRSPASAAFSMIDHLQDLEALIQHLNLKQFGLLGWSLGGILALELALSDPTRIRGLVLVATAARPVGNHPPTTWLDQINTGIASILNALAPGWQWSIDVFGRHSLYRYLLRQHTPTAYRYLAAQALPAYFQTSAQAQQALSQALRQGYSCLDRIPSLAIPALVMAGEQDCHITAEASHQTAEAMPNAHWLLYPDTAHLFPWEIPQQVQADLQVWIRQQKLAEASLEFEC